jgi:putative membrane protein
MYYTIKQVLDDPETRGTILLPLGILLLIYPVSILADSLSLPGSSLGIISGLLGLYLLARGLGVEQTVDRAVERVRTGLYAGRLTIITSVVAAGLLVVGGLSGVRTLEAHQTSMLTPVEVVAALLYGAVRWIAAAGVTSSLGRLTDGYLSGRFEWRHLNAPFYVLAIAAVLHGVSAYFLGFVDLSYMALVLTGGTLLGLASTLAFAIAESRLGHREPAA